MDRVSRRHVRAALAIVAAAWMASLPLDARAQDANHNTCEADEGHACCVVRITIGLPGGEFVSFAEVGRIFPEWEAVERADPDYTAGRAPNAVLEGTVSAPENADDTGTGPHVSFEDTPFAHDTHDFAFHVRPDEAYQHLLGTRRFNTCSFQAEEACVPICQREPPPDGFCPAPCFPNPDGDCMDPINGGQCLVCPSGCQEDRDGSCTKVPGTATCENIACTALRPECIVEIKTQDEIEVEWESGVGADNDSNPCHSRNEAGDSCGFFSAGHRRRELIWQWPTVGDHVHVEGAWVFDRGHPPARSELHPPRLVATQRRLPALLGGPGGFVIATRDDVFASGDSGALFNNRSGVPSFVRRVAMSEKDYTFKVTHDVPPPSTLAHLRWNVVTQEGDTFAPTPIVTQDSQTGSDGVVRLLPTVTVTLPWQSQGAPDTAVFARTIYVWWGTGDDAADMTVSHGVAADYRPRLFRVTPDYILMNDGSNDMLEPGIGQGDMDLRMFVEAGGNWLFANELAPADVHNVLEDGVGDADDDTVADIVDLRSGTPQPWQFTLALAPGASFRLHAGGWESDGINNTFGELLDPNAACDCEFEGEFTGQFGVFSTYLSGGRDDAIGEVNHVIDCRNADAELGDDHAEFIRDPSRGGDWTDDITSDTVHQDDVFRVQFHVQELPWPGASGITPPGGPCDTSPPAITIVQPTATPYTHSALLTLSYSAFDVGGSGVRQISALMDGAATVAGHGLASGQAIDLLTEMTLGSHTFTVSAVDYLGNAGSQSVTFEIIVTPESIIDDVNRFLASGGIAADRARSLLKKLEALAAARKRGNCNASGYGDFINEVQAQAGKKIDPAVAAILIADAQYLATHCP